MRASELKIPSEIIPPSKKEITEPFYYSGSVDFYEYTNKILIFTINKDAILFLSQFSR